MKRNYKLFLEDISERIEKIESYIGNMTFDEFKISKFFYKLI